jgi:RNA polymerase sigma factor (sigma-70 family)
VPFDIEPPEESFETVYGRYRKELKAYFRKFRSVRKCAEELVQETYLRLLIYPKLDEVREPERLVFWLAYRVMCSESERLSTQSKLLVSLDALAEISTALPRLLVVDDSSADVDRDDLLRNLAALPPEQLRMLELHYVEHLTVQQISGITGINVNTVKSILKQALKNIREFYGDGALKKQVRKQQRNAP